MFSYLLRTRLSKAMVLAFLGFAVIPSAFAQNVWWTARYNDPTNANDLAMRTVADSFDNVFTTGTSWSSTHGFDIVTIKYDSNGVKQWIRRWDGLAHLDDTATCIALDPQGNVLVAGSTRSNAFTSDHDFVVVKYDVNGNKLWTTRFDGEGNGDDVLAGLGVDPNGNVYVAGRSWGLDTHYDYATVKYSPIGNRRWVALYRGLGGVADDMADGLVVNPDGSVTVAGHSWDGTTGYDFATVKYSAAGAKLWDRRLTGTAGQADDIPFGIVRDGTSNTLVFGESDQSSTGSGIDWFLVEYGPTGTMLWHTWVNGSGNGNDEARAVAVLPTGEMVIAGTVTNMAGDADMGFVTFDTTGAVKWSAAWHGLGNSPDVPMAGVTDGTSNTIFTGETNSKSGSSDCLTLKFSPTGNLLWTRRFGSDTTQEVGLGITCDSFGNPIICGAATRLASNWDYLTVKYKP